MNCYAFMWFTSTLYKWRLIFTGLSSFIKQKINVGKESVVIVVIVKNQVIVDLFLQDNQKRPQVHLKQFSFNLNF